ncbi:uncharacterized protein N7458_008254 [Penicillium daleae]|uniref:Uncharacterized protein n=1 Tax=Penicillium daleae TaxID=63821 RepID=A0AAD6C3H7_9EURO|nr:uncharacterized protein N7458_008254 [Penicillium daleae]KAJ5444382.1 hypothetical protein N7458_008254 [Penicillium daleae]
MRKPSLTEIVYETLFPRQRSGDPGSFAAHITRNLVPEVRVETNSFYGPLDCIEAQYPGLDYAYPPHRVRLSRFQWHRRLFRAFDELKLTEEEILDLCCWEGTKSARNRYELEEGITVRDTTGDATRVATPTPPPAVTIHPDFYTLTEEPEEEDYYDTLETGSDDTVRASSSRTSSVLADFPPSFGEDEFSDEEVESCGLALNNRLLAATAARAQGVNVPVDEVYEQWLKDNNERRGYGWMMAAIRANQPLDNPEAATSSSPSSPITDDFGPRVQVRQVEEAIRSASLAAARNAAEARHARYPEPPEITNYSYVTTPRHHLN